MDTLDKGADGDMFDGQDHLVLDRAYVQAFAGQWPPLQ